MRLSSVTLFCVLCFMPEVLQAQSQKAKPEPMSCGAPAASAQQVEALQADVKKMRALLAQMQTNLAFVQNAPTPLKHQFELEIDMWRALLDHMERNMAPPAPPKKQEPGAGSP